MEKKYELVKDDFVMVNGNKLYRIKSLIDIEPWVAAGQLGGYIEKEENLSHEGNCWVFDHAMVYDKAVVKDNAVVSLNAQVYGQAIVSGDSIVTDHATIHGNAMLKGHIRVSGYASIFKDAKVYGSANIDFKVTGEDEVIVILIQLILVISLLLQPNMIGLIPLGSLVILKTLWKKPIS